MLELSGKRPSCSSRCADATLRRDARQARDHTPRAASRGETASPGRCSTAAHRYAVPVFTDAAAETLEVPNIHLKRGADVALEKLPSMLCAVAVCAACGPILAFILRR